MYIGTKTRADTVQADEPQIGIVPSNARQNVPPKSSWCLARRPPQAIIETNEPIRDDADQLDGARLPHQLTELES